MTRQRAGVAALEGDAVESFSTAEVARMAGVSVPTIQRWVDQGLLRGWKTLGGHRRVDAESAQRLLARQAPAQPAAAPAVTDNPSVLLVDDDPLDQQILQALVTEVWPRARLIVTDNGFRGLVAVGQRPVDIVVSDVRMPHMNGVEMLRQLSLLAHAPPRLLVVVTSLDDGQIADLGGLPAGVLLVRKPVEPGVAVAALSSAWQQADAAR